MQRPPSPPGRRRVDAGSANASKTCERCGRSFSWRKKWAAQWEQLRYCSQRCRRSRPSDLDRAVESAILELLAARPTAASMCPSEAARRVFDEATWHTQMERCRQAARRLVAAGHIEITQRGVVVDPDTARGPIRLRLRRNRP
jgi:hypothetical protein